jgi:hypothetical protein
MGCKKDDTGTTPETNQTETVTVQSSSCEDTELAQRYYGEALPQTALQYLTNTGYADSVLFPKEWIDSVTLALNAISNATGIEGYAEVFGEEKPEVFVYPPLSGIQVIVDSSFSGIEAWKNNETVTGNDTIGHMVDRYALSIEKIEAETDTTYRVYVRAGEEVNTPALIEEFTRVSAFYRGIPGLEPFIFSGDRRIIFDLDSEYYYITFEILDEEREIKYAVRKSDCQVTLL